MEGAFQKLIPPAIKSFLNLQPFLENREHQTVGKQGKRNVLSTMKIVKLVTEKFVNHASVAQLVRAADL